jgi:hypothetical protein
MASFDLVQKWVNSKKQVYKEKQYFTFINIIRYFLDKLYFRLYLIGLNVLYLRVEINFYTIFVLVEKLKQISISTLVINVTLISVWKFHYDIKWSQYRI